MPQADSFSQSDLHIDARSNSTVYRRPPRVSTELFYARLGCIILCVYVKLSQFLTPVIRCIELEFTHLDQNLLYFISSEIYIILSTDVSQCYYVSCDVSRPCRTLVRILQYSKWPRLH